MFNVETQAKISAPQLLRHRYIIQSWALSVFLNFSKIINNK